MSQISKSSSAAYLSHDMKDCINTTYNALHRSKRKTDSSKIQKMSEEEILLARAVNRVSRLKPRLAESFLKGAVSTYHKLEKKGEEWALFRAVESKLNEFAKAGKIAAEKVNSIMRVALGKSDMDSDIVHLGQKETRIKGKGSDGRSLSCVDAIIKQGRENRYASMSELEGLRKKIYGDGGAAASTSTTQESKADSVPQTDPLPTAEQNETGPNDMAFYPASKLNNGKADFVLPVNYSELVDSVLVYDSAGNIVDELRGEQKSSDGRRHFYSNFTGYDLGQSLRFVLHFIDGTYIEKSIADASEFWKQSYVA